jgi:hypothetical protein
MRQARRLGWGCTILALAAVVPVAVPATGQPGDARADGSTRAVCRYEAHAHVVGGDNQLTPGPVVDETVRPGRIECQGALAGRPLAATPGTIAWHYIGGTAPAPKALGGDGCATWGGDGQMTLRLPLADGGRLALDGPFTAAGVAAAGVLRARFGAVTFSGPVYIRPEPGHEDQDCVTKPFNRFIVNGEMLVR